MSKRITERQLLEELTMKIDALLSVNKKALGAFDKKAGEILDAKRVATKSRAEKQKAKPSKSMQQMKDEARAKGKRS